MRITNGMMVDKFLVNMQTNMEKMDRYTSQLSSNRKIVRLSDDPVGVYNALTARQRLARYEQYQRNLVTARSWVEQCDTSLQEVSSKLTDVNDQLVYAATNVKTEGDRKNIAALATELRNTLMDALNASVGGQYIFAGYNTVNPPLTKVDQPDGREPLIYYNGVDLTDMTKAATIEAEQKQKFQIEVGYGLQMEVAITAIDVVGVGDNNLFKTCNAIIELMNSGDETAHVVEQLSAQLDKLSTAHENVLSSLVRAGAMYSQIEILENRYSGDIINYNDIRSRIEDIDSAEVIMDWKMADAVYKQSLSTGARVIMPTLMDFLK